MLVQMGSVKAGERVLVHARRAASAWRRIDLCKIYGAEVIGTASRRSMGCSASWGAAHLIDYNTQDYEPEVKRLTSGRGVHIVLDAMGGEHWKKGYRSLATDRAAGECSGYRTRRTGKTRSIWSFVKTLLRTPLFSFPPAAA